MYKIQKQLPASPGYKSLVIRKIQKRALSDVQSGPVMREQMKRVLSSSAAVLTPQTTKESIPALSKCYKVKGSEAGGKAPRTEIKH